MRAPLVAIFLVAVLPASAAEFVTLGFGVSTCADFATDMRTRNSTEVEFHYYNWAQGYMTGINSVLLGMRRPVHNLSAKTADQQKAHIRRFCDQRPLVPYYSAVNDLLETLPKLPVPQSN